MLLFVVSNGAQVSGIGVAKKKRVEASDEELGQNRGARRITESTVLKRLVEVSDGRRRKETP